MKIGLSRSNFLRSVIFVGACAVAVGLLGGPPDARADLVLAGGSIAASFTDLGSQGYGNAPRLLTLQATGSLPAGDPEAGQLVYTGGVAASANYQGNLSAARNDVPNPCCTDVNKASVPTLGSLGWTSGADVKIGMNTSEASTGITLQNLVLSLYNNSNTVVGTFSLPSAIAFPDTELDKQPGNGNAIFEFVLSPAEQTAFNNLLTGTFSTFHIALAAAFTDVIDGPESFLAVLGPGSPLLVPEPGSLVLFGVGLIFLRVASRRFSRTKD